MKFLVDNALSPKLAMILQENGHDAVHVRDLGLADASDENIIEAATEQSRVVITADADFGRILALLNLQYPSVIFVRKDSPHRAGTLGALLLTHLERLESDIERGCLVVVRREHIRVRPLPIAPE